MQPVKIILAVSFILEICIKVKRPLLWDSHDHQTLILIHDLSIISELMFFMNSYNSKSRDTAVHFQFKVESNRNLSRTACNTSRARNSMQYNSNSMRRASQFQLARVQYDYNTKGRCSMILIWRSVHYKSNLRNAQHTG